MRHPLLVLAAGAVLLPSLAGSTATAASPQGTYLTPFREDGARYVAATNTFVGGRYAGRTTDANGCITSPSSGTGAPAGNPRSYDCLPAGASMITLPGGKVLFWNALEGEEQIAPATSSLVTDGGRFMVNDPTRVLDPATHRFLAPRPVDAGAHNATHPDDLPLGPLSAKHYPYDDGDLFCSDQVFLPDGSVYAVGGTDWYAEPYVPVADKGVSELGGAPNTRVFDIHDNTWRQGPRMSYGRWYPSLITLGNGDLFVASGVTKLLKPAYPGRPADSGTNVRQTETLQVHSARPVWRTNPASAARSLPLYPRLHLLPDGHVYYDAAGQDFSPAGEAYDEATWYDAASYDPRTRSWTDLGIPGADPAYLAANPAAAPFVGFRGSTFSAALTMRPTSVRGGVPTYTSASFLTAGGVLLPTPGSYFPVANSRISTVTTSGGTEALSTVGTGDLATARWFGTATPLPTGQVFLTSGANVDEVDLPGSESPIRSDELFTPTVDAAGHYTGGSWAPAGSQARKRTYHNNAVLLPDGSVLIGGHAPIVTGYYRTMDTPDLPGRDGTNNHHDASFQIWRPPYFSDPRRPQLGFAEPSRPGTLTVEVSRPDKIASVVLMRNTAQTHLIDGDGRTVSLPILSRTATTVTVGLPSTTNVLPNGPYLLFANASTTRDLSGRNPADLLPSRGLQLFVRGTTVPELWGYPVVVASHGKAKAKAKGVGHGKAKGHQPRLAAVVPSRVTVRSAPDAALSSSRAPWALPALLGLVPVFLVFRRRRRYG